METYKSIEDAIKFYELIIETNGNPSTKDLRDKLGFTDKKAEYMVTRIAGNPYVTSESLVESAKTYLEKLKKGEYVL